MTVATNALLEGRGARTALVATEGFTDLVELGRQARADLYRLCAAHPAPLVPAERRFGAPERTGTDGVLRALGAATRRPRSPPRSPGCEPESVAVVLLHGYRHPEHELRIGEALRERIEGVHVSLSHEVVGTFREFERAATTEVDAALSPLLGAYLRELLRRARGARAARAVDHAVQRRAGRRPSRRRARRGHGPQRPCGRCGRRGAASPTGPASATSCASTWAGPRATSASSRTARCARPAPARCRGGRWRCRWSTSTRSARAAARSPGATRAAPCGSARGRRAPSPGPRATDAAGPSRRSPTRTSCSAHLDVDTPLAGGVQLDASAAERAVGALASELGARAARVRRRDRAGRERRDGARAARDDGRARRGPARLRAAGLRRRRSAARGRGRRGARA